MTRSTGLRFVLLLAVAATLWPIRPVFTRIGRPEDLQLTTFDTTLEALVAAAIDHAPMLRRDQIMIDRSQIAVAAARKDYKPDFALTGGYDYMGAMPPMYEFRFDVKVPLQRARPAANRRSRLDEGACVRTVRITRPASGAMPGRQLPFQH